MSNSITINVESVTSSARFCIVSRTREATLRESSRLATRSDGTAAITFSAIFESEPSIGCTDVSTHFDSHGIVVNKDLV